MLNPICILHNIMDPSSKVFVCQQLAKFKAAGYETILIDMNKDVGLEGFKRQLRGFGNSAIRSMAKATLELIEEAERQGMRVELIDPQTQTAATRIYIPSIFANTATARASAQRNAQAVTNARDVLMAKDYSSAVKETDGGVICFVAYMYKYFVQEVCRAERDVSNKTLFMVASDFEPWLNTRFGDAITWEQLPSDDFRRDFYQAEVSKLKLSASYDFKAFSEQFAFYNTETHTTQTAQLLGDGLGCEVKCHVDNQYFVTAIFTSDSTQDIEAALKQKFPGLRFSTVPGQGVAKVVVPKINDAAVAEEITAAFKKLGL